MEVEGFHALQPSDVAQYAKVMLTDQQVEIFREKLEIDLAYSVPGVGRFRANVYRQRGSIAIAMRTIPFTVGTFVELGLPPILEKIAQEHRGLILVTGSTGSGKSTTLASIVDFINTTRTSHIVTIEDPIEFLIRDKMSMVAQREVGFDTHGFLNALRAAMRQDPDVILVGEMRDVETIMTTLMAAETGHLVLATLHTTDVMETINRILPISKGRNRLKSGISSPRSPCAIICQRLIRRLDNSGRVPAVEVMVSTSRIAEFIRDPKRTHEIRDAIAGGYSTYGMQTFDMSLMKLVLDKKISYQEALDNATNAGDFALKFKGISSTSDADLAEFQRLSGNEDKKRKNLPKSG